MRCDYSYILLVFTLWVYFDSLVDTVSVSWIFAKGFVPKKGLGSKDGSRFDDLIHEHD